MRARMKGNLGLTLVETMVAIVVGAVVLMAATVSLAAVHKMVVRVRDQSLVRQDLRVATTLIRSSARACMAEEISIADEGTTLTITSSDGTVTTIKKVDMNLVRQSGDDSDILIRGGLVDLKFELVPGYTAETTLLKVTLAVAANDASSTTSFTTGFRNKLET